MVCEKVTDGALTRKIKKTLESVKIFLFCSSEGIVMGAPMCTGGDWFLGIVIVTAV